MDAVVVTYNSAREITRLLADERVAGSFERIIVVDNGSSDATLDVAHDLGALVLDRGGNGGFAVGVNAGVRAAQGDRFAVINPDIGSSHADDLAGLRADVHHP